MTRLLAFLRPCPLRVVTPAERVEVASSSRDDRPRPWWDEMPVTPVFIASKFRREREERRDACRALYCGQDLRPFVGGGASQANAPSAAELQDMASNSRRWR